ncbi:polysaccharide pyruvyl transferase family protein [Paenibacillus validus]|uniref:polysaccharide pyruvyl transferase family protein n=1 Tax=Paenibacillus validus TaxID=44253 RepID=UPI000FD70687|nr:polysaccharide pyruvyl transferase family protein [Paenibacillus validus]MED4600761.1 polysaccharide pyruvyl transferase family protein [Paenibacillus validus]MED4606168.1 polysaccharide pyruvyl transferase family protein [Paenibacillus validus]
MKVGIFTFHDADNYGAVLQAYALQETVKFLTNDVEIVNYKQPYIIDKYKVVRINNSSLLKLIRSIISTLIRYKDTSRKKEAFNNFRKRYLNISEEIYKEKNEIKGYDIYISGSDQVWNPEITNFDEVFFLKFSNEGRKISYAASIGRDEISEKEKDFLKNNIKNLDLISVREDSALKILNGLTENRVERVLDPTLLADTKIWDELICGKSANEYLLVYTVGPIGNVMEIANYIAKKMGIKIINITDKIMIKKYNVKTLRDIGPESFVGLFKNATFIITNSFHGTAFSIIFNKDFLTIPHKTGGTRMIDLLNLLKLDARIINNQMKIDDYLEQKIDYTVTNKILNEEKEKSLEFLKNAIQNI